MTENTPPQKDFKQRLLDKIQEGHVKMHSKIYYALKIAAVIGVGAAALVACSFFMSFIFFSFQIGGELSLLGFGGKGIQLFFLMFPWKLLFIIIALLFLLEWLFNTFRFAYQTPFVYMLGGLLAASIVLGSIISVTPLHDTMMIRARQKNLPLMHMFYDDLRRSPQNRVIFPGIITKIKNNMLIVENDDFENTGEIKVYLPEDRDAGEKFSVGERVSVAGEWQDGEFYAFGVKKIGPGQGGMGQGMRFPKNMK